MHTRLRAHGHRLMAVTVDSGMADAKIKDKYIVLMWTSWKLKKTEVCSMYTGGRSMFVLVFMVLMCILRIIMEFRQCSSVEKVQK